MALLGSFIDTRTITSALSTVINTFAHGLPATPDFIIIQGIGAVAATVAQALPTWVANATNVTLAGGGTVSPNIHVTSVVAHSIIR
jgi:hypothetical protein